LKQIPATAARFLFSPYLYAWEDFKEGMEVLVQGQGHASFARNGAISLLGLLLCWEIYVPVHELLHVAGCVASGGKVHELNMSSMYGASFLKEIFPFIRVGSHYAGRLTGFSTGGSDITYFITVFTPFVLTILFGVTLLHLAARRKSPFLFGVSLVLAGAPFISLTGDYLEMGGIVVTRLVHDLAGWFGETASPDLYRFRSDDLFRLISEMKQDPSGFGIDGQRGLLRALCLTLGAQIMGVLLAGWTYYLSRRVALALTIRGREE